MADQSWRLYAKCANDDAIERMDEIVDSRTPAAIKRRRAIEFCHGCTVVRECALSARQHADIGVIAAGVVLSETANSAPGNRADLQRLKAVAGV